MSLFKPIIFIHMVKGGGVTLQQIVVRQFPRRAVLRTNVLADGTLRGFSNVSQQERDRIKFLWGHIAYGAHTFFSQPAQYITMLREPVSRVISFYYAAQEKESSPYEADQWVKKMTLAEYIESDLAMVSNFQTQLIAGERALGYEKSRLLDDSWI